MAVTGGGSRDRGGWEKRSQADRELEGGSLGGQHPREIVVNRIGLR